MTDVPELVVRHTESGEMVKVMSFYDEYQFESDNILRHKFETHLAAAEEGRHFVIEKHGEIVGSTLLVPVGDCYLEGGNDLIALPFRGYGLQKLLIKVRAAHMAVMLPAALSLVMGADPKKNGASIKSIEGCHLSRFPEYGARFKELCTGCPKLLSLPNDRVCCCDFYILQGPEYHLLIEELLDSLNGGDELTLGKGSQSRIRVRISTRVIPAHMKALEDFSQKVAL